MSSLIETLNLTGQRFVEFALPMLLQSSLLMVVIFTLDLVLRNRVRAVFRYGLWMLVLIKLILPPTFASPTGLGYWLPAKRPDKPTVLPVPAQVFVRYPEAESVHSPIQSITPLPPPRPALTWPAISLLGWASVAFGLVIWLVLRARFVARMSARANDAPESLLELLQSCCRQLKIKRPIRLKLSSDASSPAVCGLWRPTILIPAQLAGKLSALPMRAVLLHELAHIKRGDLWVNYAQTLLQIAYWYHPLLWLANAVIRRVREQAVDEMVMVEMGQEADAYPTTLLEVAKLTFARSALSLGLVGIMESKTALRERIDRLMDFRPLRKAGFTFTSALCVLAVGALALPMGKSPPPVPVATNLIHREYRVDVLTFATNLIKRGGFPEIWILNGDFSTSHNRNAYNGPLVSGRPHSVENQKTIRDALRRVLADAGVETKATEVDPWRLNLGLVDVVTTPEKLPAIERVLADLNDAPLQDVSRSHQERVLALARETATKMRAIGEGVRDSSSTNLIFTSNGRQAILKKLDRIRLDSVSFDRLPLGEALSQLNDKAKKHDPEKKGINFTINPHAEPPAGSSINAYTGLPEESERTDISSVAIKINPALTDVRLADVLDAIVKVADKPIKYSIEDYAVVFSPKTPEVAPLYTRFFKVDTNMLVRALQRRSGESSNPNVYSGIRGYLMDAGVNLDPPKNLFYKDRQGMLMVRGTLQDLDIVESAVQTLNFAPPQIMIEAKFIEVPERMAKDLWRDWPLTNSVGTNASTSILTESQLKALLKQLESKSGVDILTMPRVTTLSGRQAQIQTVDIRTIVKAINPQALTPPGITSTDGASNSLYLTETMPFGPVLDVIPYVMADGYTISMTLIPTVTEFLGYDKNRSGRVPVYIKGKRDWATPPLPKFRSRQIVTSALVWDGQTLMLGNPLDASNQIAEKPGDGKKHLIVLVTPTLIDPAGNRVHTEEEMPFAREGIPSQQK